MLYGLIKHHNTLKLFVCVASNSAITFILKAYTGRINDKAITLKSGFLDIIPRYSIIMADKGFNIVDDCVTHCIQFIVPPARRGVTQMTPEKVKKLLLKRKCIFLWITLLSA